MSIQLNWISGKGSLEHPNSHMLGDSTLGIQLT